MSRSKNKKGEKKSTRDAYPLDTDTDNNKKIAHLLHKDTEKERIQGYITWSQSVLTYITRKCGVTVAKAIQEQNQDMVWKLGLAVYSVYSSIYDEDIEHQQPGKTPAPNVGNRGPQETDHDTMASPTVHFKGRMTMLEIGGETPAKSAHF